MKKGENVVESVVLSKKWISKHFQSVLKRFFMKAQSHHKPIRIKIIGNWKDKIIAKNNGFFK